MPKPKKFSKELTMDDLVRLAVGEDSYRFDDEYKEMTRELNMQSEELDRLNDERKSIENDLEKEKQPMDEAYKEFVEEMRQIYAEEGDYDEDEFQSVVKQTWREIKGMEQKYSAKGNELNKKLNEIRSQIRAVERLISSTRNRIDDYGKSRSENEFEYRNKPFTPLSQKDYKGFSMKQTVNYINEHLEKGTARIVEMTPKEYLQRVAHQVFHSKSTTAAVHGTSPSQVAKYAQMMKNGTKFETPYLNLRDRSQEGRHRALAAIINGYKKIPVIVIE